MGHWKKKVCSDAGFLHHWHIDGSSPVTVTIAEVGFRTAHSQDGTKELFCLIIKGKEDLPFGLNVTNGEIMQALHGKDDADWPGKKITLRTAMCRGDECIRIDGPKGMRFSKAVPKFTYTDKAAQ